MSEPFRQTWSGFIPLRNSMALWGGVGLVCAVINPLPAAVIAGVIAAGLAVGSLCGFWLMRGKVGWLERTRLVACLLLIVVLVSGGWLKTVLQYLAAGSFLSVGISAGVMLVAFQVMRGINAKYAKAHEAFHRKKTPAPPPQATQEGDRAVFLDALPPHLRDEMAASFVTVTAVEPQDPASTPPSTASSFGGSPLLPPGTEWPVRNGRPLKFLAQLNLEEVDPWSPEIAPKQGLLSFFYDEDDVWGRLPEDKGSAHVIYTPDPSLAVTVLAPSDETTSRQALRFHKHLSYFFEDTLSDSYYSYYHSLKLEEKDVLSVLFDRAINLPHSENRLFCHPYLIQNDMWQETEIAARAFMLPPETPWTMVLQLGSVEEQGWCWGDAGCICFWVPTEDLAVPRFDRAWVVLQCG